MLLDVIIDVGVIVSEEAGVTATDGSEVVVVAVLSDISPVAKGDGVIVSEVGAEIVVTTGCGRGGISTGIVVVNGDGGCTVPPLMRRLNSNSLSLCPSVNFDGVSFTSTEGEVGGGGRESDAVARD